MALLLFSCNKENPDVPGTPADLNLKEGSEFVIESMNEFGLDIFRLLHSEEEEDVNEGSNMADGLTSDSLASMVSLASSSINALFLTSAVFFSSASCFQLSANVRFALRPN